MKGASVGVAMATFNGERYLRAQIDSILGQGRMPDRLVIVDDASTDSTPRILDEYARRHTGIVRVSANRRNRGAPYTFAKAMTRCDTRYIALTDQDDEWLPEKLAVMLGAAARHPAAGMWFHDMAIINPQGETRAQSFWAVTPEGEPLPVEGSAARTRLARYSNPVPGCTMLIDAGLLPEILPIPDLAVGHDWWISAVCFFMAAPKAVAQPLGRYRLHPHQAAGIGTRLDRRKDEKLQLPLHLKLMRECRRLWRSARAMKVQADQRSVEKRQKITVLVDLLDRALAGECPPERVAEYRRLRAEIAGRSEAGK